MKLLHEFKDDIYPFQEIAFEKHASRAIILNQDGKMALVRMYIQDKINCYITPGGGIEPGETPEMAVKRESLEELGLECEILHEIGMIIDYFYDIRRKTVSYYYVLRALSEQATNWTDQEQELIQAIEWFTIDEAVHLLETFPADPRGATFHRRDLLAIREAKHIIERS
jgi:8-oxo-dGTP pyrophosphatase MutT (NUDIX family)